MFLPEDLWREIKSFIIHNIKIHGLHLKNDIYVKKFNKVLKCIPGKYKPNIGPIIVYGLPKENFRTVKFIYYVPAPRSIETNGRQYKLIIEYMSLDYLKQTNVNCCDCYTSINKIPTCIQKKAKKEYHENAIKKIWFL